MYHQVYYTTNNEIFNTRNLSLDKKKLHTVMKIGGKKYSTVVKYKKINIDVTKCYLNIN